MFSLLNRDDCSHSHSGTLSDVNRRPTTRYAWLIILLLLLRLLDTGLTFRNTRFLFNFKRVPSAAASRGCFYCSCLRWQWRWRGFFLFVFIFFSFYRVVVNHKRKSVKDAVGHHACYVICVETVEVCCVCVSLPVLACATRVSRCCQLLRCIF